MRRGLVRHPITVWFLALSMVLVTLPAALGSGGQQSPPTPVPLGPSVEGPADPHARSLEDGLAAELASGAHGVIVHFEERVPAPAASALLDRLDVRYRFQNIPALYAIAPQGSGAALAASDEVAFVEDAWKPIEFLLESATVATRVREVLDPDFEPPEVLSVNSSPAVLDGDGDPIDGSGVGIAVVDSGLDASHPAFQGPRKVQANYLVTPNGPVEAPSVPSAGIGIQQTVEGVQVHAKADVGGSYTETSASPCLTNEGGHGTHVAGIAAGTGAGSGDPWSKGVAPGSSLYSFNAAWIAPDCPVRDGVVVSPAIAFDWILENGDQQDPPIQVVSAAWSCRLDQCNELNPDWAHVELARQLAEDGVTVVFPAGDSTGEGFESQTSPECNIQTPGVICVGNYDDEQVGTRGSCTDSTSSRGQGFEPGTWPDLVAPGDEIRSPNPVGGGPGSRAPASAGPGSASGHPNAYSTQSGSSAAAAHVAGGAALLLQANPSLSSDEVEWILEETAFKLTLNEDCQAYLDKDPMHPGDPANFAAGHGLLDALTAVQAASSFDGIPDRSEPTTSFPEDWLTESGITGLDDTFYLTADSMTRSQPGFGPPTVEPLVPGLTMVRTSPPLESGFTTSGVLAHIWNGCQSCLDGDLMVTVERAPADGGPSQTLLQDSDVATYTPRPVVTPTQFNAVLDEPVTFEPGDRVRVEIWTVGDNDSPTANENATFASVAMGAQPTPSKVSFGHADPTPDPGSTSACIAESTCSLLGGDLHTNHVRCEFVVHHVVWTGPPGSRASMACDQTVASCQVPWDVEGDVGTCRAESETSPFIEIPGYCTYTIPPNATGPRTGGHGHCGEGHLPGR